ncbi:Os06g0265301 [Oryza sativa Japonica Group]|nr:Os06g0265301 [Oryza sativa Japonica Group]
MADLLLAVRLIEVDRHHHRHKDRFQFRSHAAKAALRCAALSTRLPDVDADAFLIGLSAPVSHLAHSLSAENSGPSSPPLDSRCDQVNQIDAEAAGSEEFEQSYGSCCYEMP